VVDGVENAAPETVRPQEPAQAEQAQSGQARVSTLELFFDLVFVFTVTQLTAVLADDLTWRGGAQVVVMLSLLMWMYGGYAWMTNAIAPNSPVRRTMVLVGMGGFLTISLAISDAFGATGWAFGVGYFVVNAVHSGLFMMAGGAGAVRAFRRLGPLNLLAATLILVGGFAPSDWRWALWVAAMLVQFASPYLNPIGEFTISPSHFVERHGLLIIIALGESVVAIGVGAAGLELTPLILVVAVLGLAVAYLLWWIYFGGGTEVAEEAFTNIEPERRARTAIHAFGWAHLGLFLGIVAVSAGIKKSVAHADGHLHLDEAMVLAAGLAVFLGSDVAFRLMLRMRPVLHRAVAAFAVFAVVPAAMAAGVWGLAVALAILYVMLFFEDRARGVRWGDRRAWTLPEH
jgi:low temperature requirement protein LtrA